MGHPRPWPRRHLCGMVLLWLSIWLVWLLVAGLRGDELASMGRSVLDLEDPIDEGVLEQDCPYFEMDELWAAAAEEDEDESQQPGTLPAA